MEQIFYPAAPRNSGLKFKLLLRIARFIRKYQPPFGWTDRFLRLIYPPEKRQTDHLEIVISYDTDLLLRVNTGLFLEWFLFFHGYHEPGISWVIKQLFRPGFVAFDVGASMGDLTLLMSRQAGKKGKVFAVEPHPVFYQRLLRNIALNCLSNIVPSPCALSSTSGQATLFLPETWNAHATSLHGDFLGTEQRHGEITVQVLTLDEVVKEHQPEKLDFIKIDTAGHELRILGGAEKSIEKFHPYVVFKYSERTFKAAGCTFQEVRQFLEKKGYTLYILAHDHLLPVEHWKLRYSENLLAVPNY